MQETIAQIIQVNHISKSNRNPLPALTTTITPVYLVLYCLGGGGRVPLPFPIIDLVHMQFSAFFGTDEQLFNPNRFYLVTGLLVKRTAVTQTAQYPVAFGTSP